MSHTITNNSLNQFKTIVVARAFLPIKPTSKLDKYNRRTFFHKYIMGSSKKKCGWPAWLLILIALRKVRKVKCTDYVSDI